MASGNGDDRWQAILDRIEAKLDRILERMTSRPNAPEKQPIVRSSGPNMDDGMRRLFALMESVGCDVKIRLRESDAQLDRLRDELSNIIIDPRQRELVAIQMMTDEKLSELERLVRELPNFGC